LLADPELSQMLKVKRTRRPGYAILATYDRMIRWRHRDKLRRLLGMISEVDVYIAVASVAAERGFVFPVAIGKDSGMVKWEGVYHPAVKNAVGNSLCMGQESNILFLTGANMAGKSTLMKTLAIALFLGHMGFPVSAKSLEFPVRDGIYTTINLSDNLDQGVSHFYAEVCRVREMAQALAQGRQLFIVFDELFRGTNVKDAYDATIAVTEALAGRTNCLFIVSTHIMEAGEVLRERCRTIRFRYLPTLMQGDRPVYPYLLEEGISDDRHGMVIIRNEGILDILNNGRHQKKAK
ncbi:MAG: DNA mismatch repair protein, partial [Bacteroidota bacterium]|nr:DNA mismatch repair protein [Bacteroidota bacterium]